MDIQRIASLSRLQLTEDEETMMAAQLPEILAYVGKLQEVDTSNVDVKAYLTTATNVLRVDEAFLVDDAHRKMLIDAFPEKTGDALKVPGVFE